MYIAIGAHVDKKLGLEGEESSNVISAVELLRGVGDGNVPDFTGKKICVIGGGNVSMDATRTALRLGAESVTCVYRRRVEDMTALAEEIEEAMAEGCQILPLQAPVFGQVAPCLGDRPGHKGKGFACFPMWCMV